MRSESILIGSTEERLFFKKLALCCSTPEPACGPNVFSSLSVTWAAVRSKNRLSD